MDFNNITKGKCVPLGIIMIVIFYLVGETTSTIYPFILLTTMMAGYIKGNNTVSESAVTGLIISVIGTLITVIINVALIYVSYGGQYASYMIAQTLPFTLLIGLIVGAVGGVLGYYIRGEMKLE